MSLSPVKLFTRLPHVTRRHFGRLLRRYGCKVGAEIGVLKGEFSERLCSTVPGLRLYCVDPYTPYMDGRSAWGMSQATHDANYQEATTRLSPYSATFILKPSLEASLCIPDSSLDFVYIDGDHSYDAVMLDLIVWSRKVRRGGIVAGHDYMATIRGCDVLGAVHDYANAHNLISRAYYTGDRWPSFWWEKP